MTRAKLEALVEDLISRTIPPCQTALKDLDYLQVKLMKLYWLRWYD